VTLLPVNWDERLTESTEYRDITVESPLSPENQIQCDLKSPGSFSLTIRNLAAVRLSDNREFFIPWFLVPQEIIVTDRQFTAEWMSITLDPEGVYQVLLIDSERRPLKNRELTFHACQVTVTLHTGDTGGTLFLGNPTRFQFELEQGAGLEILPV
jgi:hypothetical protein